ncbi:MAG: hypothetical protein KAU60_04790 [Desulfobacterales bacterium]|nr:hypothetical protein [Desulfobacterales bacterium]
MITATVSVTLVAEVIFIKGIATGAIRFHNQRFIFHGRLILVAGKVILFYNFGHALSFLL